MLFRSARSDRSRGGGCRDERAALWPQRTSQNLLNHRQGEDRVVDEPGDDEKPTKQPTDCVVDRLAMHEDPGPSLGSRLHQGGEELVDIVGGEVRTDRY